MAFIAFTPQLGEVNLTDVDPVGPGPFVVGGGATRTFGRASFYNEVLEGYDNVLGAGYFTYAQASGAITVGQVVQFAASQDASYNMVVSASAWTGMANSGRGLGVAVIALANGQWGWFQIGGNAIVATSGAVTANSPAYWQANGVVSTTPVAGKQMLGAQFSTANSATLGTGNAAVVLTASQSVMLLNAPVAQGAIT